jgi:hypothetical protein
MESVVATKSISLADVRSQYKHTMWTVKMDFPFGSRGVLMICMHDFDILEKVPAWVNHHRPIFTNPEWYYDFIESYF